MIIIKYYIIRRRRRHAAEALHVSVQITELKNQLFGRQNIPRAL